MDRLDQIAARHATRYADASSRQMLDDIDWLVAEVRRLRAGMERKQEALILADEHLEADAMSHEDTERFAAGIKEGMSGQTG